MQKILFCFVSFFCLQQSRAAGTAGYIQALKTAMKQYHCTYEATYRIPGGKPVSTKGIMCVAGNRLYDSSALHLIMKNPEWLVSVDFPSQYCSVIKNKADKDNPAYNPTPQYLVSDDFFDKNIAWKVKKETADKIWLAAKPGSKSPVRDISVAFDKATLSVLSITMELEQAMEGDERGDQKMSLSLSLDNIKPQIPDLLFSEKRFFRVNGNKVILKKYTQYQLSYHQL